MRNNSKSCASKKDMMSMKKKMVKADEKKDMKMFEPKKKKGK